MNYEPHADRSGRTRQTGMNINDTKILKATCLEIAERLQERALALPARTPLKQFESLIRDSSTMRNAALIIEDESKAYLHLWQPLKNEPNE